MHLRDQLEIEKLQQQHLTNYKAALYDTIEDNTVKLIQEDLTSLFQPPLDSMNLLKMRFLNTAKEYGVVLEAERFNQILEQYYTDVLEQMKSGEELRTVPLQKIVDSFEDETEEDRITFSKDQVHFASLALLDYCIECLKNFIQLDLLDRIQEILDITKNLSLDQKEGFQTKIIQYLNHTYPDQMRDAISSKIDLKDCTLINRMEEHTERYLFTKKKSHLLVMPNSEIQKKKGPKSSIA